MDSDSTRDTPLPRPLDAPIEPDKEPLDVAAVPGGPEFWERFERFVLQLQGSLDLREVAATAVNDGRTLLGCDRVALVVRHGSASVVKGISGQEEVQSRSNLVKSLRALADGTLAGGGSLTYQGELEGLPPTLERLLADYLLESRSRMVHIVPLQTRTKPGDAVTDDMASRPSRRIVGCLVIEQLTEGRAKAGLLETSELLADHVAAAVANAQRHEGLFLLPVWRALGRGWGWFRGRNLRITAAVLLGVGLLAVALAIVPWEYRVEATGLAMPVIQHGVFAPRDAIVEKVLVEGNQRAPRGTPLLHLRSPELEERATQLRGEIGRIGDEVYKLLRDQEEARRAGDREREQQAYTEFRQARTELAAQQEELRIVDEQRQQLTLLAPADGVVATFQVEELLRNRPVRRGELLLEVMDDAGDWRLELEVPEHRLGHLLAALRDSAQHELVVDYTPATDVRLNLTAALRGGDVSTRSNESQDEQTIVQVYADIDPDDLPGRRIGAEVDAHIRCGKRSLFYCLFGDVVEFVQRRVWW